MTVTDWPDYLAQFHTEHAGITEQVLRRASLEGRDAYDWVAEAVPPGTAVLDLACGSAPVWAKLHSHAYFGVDVSGAELALARGRGARHLSRATASALPVPDGSIDVVTCAMALQILTPLPKVLAEIHRVLRPGGRLVATIPARRPLRAVDLPILGGLLAVLGRTLSYPNDAALAAAGTTLTAAGLQLIADEHRRFRYPLRSRPDADLFLASLYLPNLSPRRGHVARAYLHALARMHAALPVPVRRITASRP